MIADRYRLERKVGGGRVSAVWRVRDQVSGATCAVKLLHRSMHKHSEALTRFSLEDRLARELSGPHFPERVGSGSWEGLRYIAWRWHEGESLRTLFDRNPKQDAPTVHSIVQETCQALSGVHAAGYTHGDLKPENLYFAERGENDPSRQLKLIGFGVASRIVPFTAATNGRRRPGQLVGTPLYMSPDLILGRTPRGGQADLWALAVLVYEALTGRAPFLGRDLGEVLQAILERDAPRPSSIADTLPGTFDLWWAQALEQEFNTPNDFASALTRALGPALRSSHTQRSASLPERAPVTAGELGSGLGGTVVGLGTVPPAVSSSAVSSSGLTPAAAPAGAASSLAASTAAVAGSPSGSSTPAASSIPAAPSTPAAVSSGASSSSTAAASSASLSGTLTGTGPSAPSATTSPAANPTSITASGMGPAVRPNASRTVEAKTAEAPAASTAGAVPSEADRFAPLPSPLRDFNETASRKTLVGITPPNRPTGAALAVDSSGARRSVEISAVVPVHDAPAREVDSMRRPSHPTVPFPRPRLLPRLPAGEGDATPLRSTGRGQTWRGQTTRTLRFVMSSDHKPQRVAAVLVCAAAALVIFVVGRSPVSGTATIKQSTGALSPEGIVAPAPPSKESEGSAQESVARGATPGTPGKDSTSSGTELAGASVVPAEEAQTVGGSTGARGTPGAGDEARDAPRPAPTEARPRGPASKPSAPPTEAAPKSRPEIKAPIKRNPEPTPPGGRGGEFDFGI